MKTAETAETPKTAETPETDFLKSWFKFNASLFTIIKFNDNEFYIRKSDVIKLMDAYLAAELKNRVNAITDTAIKLEFSRSRCNHIHPDRFKEQGALWLKDEILKQVDHARR